MSNPMLDREFLRQLDSMKHREIYARLTSLTFLEAPIEYIEGRVTGGSINLDGASSSRRTCNLTLVAKDVNINQFYWGLTHKFKVEIGVVNTINPKYDHIIWFNEGKYIITNFNVSLNATSYTITINGKDKMSLLNGEIGGSLTAQTDFGSIDVYDNFYELKIFSDPSSYVAGKYYTRTKDKDTEEYVYTISYEEYNKNTNYYEPSSIYKKDPIPIKTIIREAVHTYGKEPYFNIIINDLEDNAVELLDYKGDKPLYLLLDKTQDVYINADIYTNMTAQGNIPCHVEKADGTKRDTTLDGLMNEELDLRVSTLENRTESIPATITFDGNNQDTQYYVSKVEYGQTVGFRETELTYAGDLIANVGESLTSVLDKIKNMLGDFEYFYDIDGRFVFQKQKIYESESWNNIVKTEDKDLLVEDGVTNQIGSAAYSSAVSYSFIDNNIITAFNNTPNLNNLRNDYSIWGVRKGIAGADLPIHLRYAIDKKPTYYKTFDGIIYSTKPMDSETKSELREDAQKEVGDVIDEERITPTRKPNPHYAGKSQLPNDWWYMSDWFNHYKKLTGTAPTDYIRFYATNRTGEGSEKGYVEDFNPSVYFNVVGPETTYGKIWLFHLVNDVFMISGSSSAQHNSQSNHGTLEEDGTITIAPFSGCSSHKYGDFITLDQNGNAYDKPGYTGFFYKPNFPEGTEEAIETHKEEEIQKYVDEHYIVCDWREIIYQMSVDYFKHNQERNFYSTVMLNNGRKENGDFRYPNGSTGYEQYYTDINAFWRELYNIDPKKDYYKQGGYYAETINWSQVDDTTFEREVVWVPYEENDAIFESDYYLPLSEKKYSTEDNEEDGTPSIIKQMANIESYQINLLTKVDDDSPVGIYWEKDGAISNLSYEIYCSFYPAAGFSVIPNAALNIPKINGKNYYYFKDSRVNLSSLGTEETLILYYRIRGFKDLIIDEETNEKRRVYTIWSNKCMLQYRKEKTVNEEGQTTGESIVVFNSMNLSDSLEERQSSMINLSTYASNFDETKKYWNKKVFNSPETLNFWIDFLDSDSELAQFSVPVVGDRPKAVNDTKVTSIYFKDIPNIIFVTPKDAKEKKQNPFDRQTGYTYISLDSSWEGMFSISSQQKSAKDVLDEYLYQYAYCIENITITSLPIYYLEPNTRIFVYDENSKINGEYIVSKITLPLAYNGTMTITANKAVNRIY